MGGLITFKTLPITVMGGLGNVRGTLVAAMLLGISESLVSYRAAVPGLRRLRDAHPDVDVATAQTVFDPGAVLNDRGSIDVGKRSLGYPMAA
jgi:ABC-type branched-subunit amino acid transport system permease subunit